MFHKSLFLMMIVAATFMILKNPKYSNNRNIFLILLSFIAIIITQSKAGRIEKFEDGGGEGEAGEDTDADTGEDTGEDIDEDTGADTGEVGTGEDDVDSAGTGRDVEGVQDSTEETATKTATQTPTKTTTHRSS